MKSYQINQGWERKDNININVLGIMVDVCVTYKHQKRDDKVCLLWCLAIKITNNIQSSTLNTLCVLQNSMCVKTEK